MKKQPMPKTKGDTSPIMLVPGVVSHTRLKCNASGSPAHHFSRRTLSLWLDLDRMQAEASKHRLFSLNRFNLLSLHEADYASHPKGGCADPASLSHRIRQIASECLPATAIASIRLLTFPRILGMVFNPLSVYEAYDKRGVAVMQVFEVRNTFGDHHTYVAINGDYAGMAGMAAIHTTQKCLYVSPFFPVAGRYRLRLRQRGSSIQVGVGYDLAGKTALYASLRGSLVAMSDAAIVRAMWQQVQFPMRPWLGIHSEAWKLWLKKATFFKRPPPPRAAYTQTDPVAFEKAKEA